MVFSEYTKLRILYLWTLQYNPPAIAAALEGEGITVSSRGVAKFIQRYIKTGKTAICSISTIWNKHRNYCKAAREWQGDTHYCRSKGHRRGADEEGWRDYSKPTARPAHLIGLPSEFKNCSPLQDCTGVDLQRQCILPAHTCSQPTEEAGLCPGEP